MADAALIAIDWGTTNRRVYLLGDDGDVLATERDDRGVLAMTGGDWAAEVAAIRARHGDLPVLIAGMAGSNRGWREASYAPCPAGARDLARRLLWVEPGRTAIIPGVCQAAPSPDVMRGEEVQFTGAFATGLVPADALLCQPGTHCKWATLVDGRIAGFTTAMTGELFDLLRTRSILAPQLSAEVEPGPAFLAGVAEGARQDLAASLFAIRAAAVLGTRPDTDAAAHASGLLIGSDVHLRLVEDDSLLYSTVYLLADGTLADLYAAAIMAQGAAVERVDSHAAFLAGIQTIRSLA